jgi:DNA-binding NtrC family response regulator
VDALMRAHGNQVVAARLLGMSRRTLINRLDAYQIPRPRKSQR